ncbi:MAG: N-formylglutamate deformylase [Hyphomicrobiales bacterium]|nr:N-formylglutamate deformylase [Hyphomicrobiales bacterium]MCP4998575.1 N-formylglutamate deformylase [Hyphomicrobiales bacterium]
MEPVEIVRGDSPVLLSLPHTGLYVPDDIKARLNETGQALTDTDWNIHRLYADLLPGATTVRATFHRYVIDANRDPSGKSLYPGQNTTTLCPLIDFDDNPLYRKGMVPDAAEIEARRLAFHAPYHAAMAAEIERVRAKHGIAVLYDCHSIRPVAPFLFPGTLPDFNIGDNEGTTCAPDITRIVADICGGAEGYTSVLNGRFKGGWTTRHYGQPHTGVHSIQMELTQKSHLKQEVHPYALDPAKSERLRVVLGDILSSIEQWALKASGRN